MTLEIMTANQALARVKKYLAVEVTWPGKGTIDDEKIEEFRLLIFGVVAPYGGHVGDCWHVYGQGHRLVSATVYWETDPADRDPKPPHPDLTEIWLRNVSPAIRDACASFRNLQIAIITDLKLKEVL